MRFQAFLLFVIGFGQLTIGKYLLIKISDGEPTGRFTTEFDM